jgi:hypothetical protein
MTVHTHQLQTGRLGIDRAPQSGIFFENVLDHGLGTHPNMPRSELDC